MNEINESIRKILKYGLIKEVQHIRFTLVCRMRLELGL